MKEYSIVMGLFDLIPVILFFLGANLIAADLRGKIRKSAWFCFVAGILLMSLAGTCKAAYKLLYAANLGDFMFLSDQFFPSQAFGFLLAGIGLAVGVSRPQKKLLAVPVMPFVFVMIVGLGAMDSALVFLSRQLKERRAMVLFIVNFFLTLIMGYLSSHEYDGALMNWIAQTMNLFVQLIFYTGCRCLHKAGLADWKPAV